jgi:hypothetical protein
MVDHFLFVNDIFPEVIICILDYEKSKTES